MTGESAGNSLQKDSRLLAVSAKSPPRRGNQFLYITVSAIALTLIACLLLLVSTRRTGQLKRPACYVGDISLVSSGSRPEDALAKIRLGFDSPLDGQEVTLMIDFVSKAGDLVLERRREIHAQSTVVEVSGASNVYVSGVKRTDVKDFGTVHVYIWRGWITKVGKEEVICETEVDARFSDVRQE